MRRACAWRHGGVIMLRVPSCACVQCVCACSLHVCTSCVCRLCRPVHAGLCLLHHRLCACEYICGVGVSHTPSIVSGIFLQRKDVVNQCLEFGCQCLTRCVCVRALLCAHVCVSCVLMNASESVRKSARRRYSRCTFYSVLFCLCVYILYIYRHTFVTLLCLLVLFIVEFE